MSEKNQPNPNYQHSCSEVKVDINGSESTLLLAGFSYEEIGRLYDFYVVHAPIVKDEKSKEKRFGLLLLKDYGWAGNAKLSSLERKLLKVADMQVMCFLKSDSIIETLKSLELYDKICVAHPRTVLLQNHTITIYENGVVKIHESESRMVCLFRHIRNALAHGCIYVFEDRILLEDSDENNKLTFRMLIHRHTLIDWISVVKGEDTL